MIKDGISRSQSGRLLPIWERKELKRIEKNVDTPYTTAWKECVTPKEAVGEFYTAILAYNAKHALDKPVVLGRGNAFAVCDNVYDAIKIC